MVARSITTGIVALIIIVVFIIAGALGFGLLQQPFSPASNAASNVTINATTSTKTATTTPSSTSATASPTLAPSGQQITVAQGQTFTIRLSTNPSTGYQWKPTFDTGALSLSNQTFVSNATSTRLVGVGGTELFTFQALRPGITSVTFDYVSPGGQTTQSASYPVTVR